MAAVLGGRVRRAAGEGPGDLQEWIADAPFASGRKVHTDRFPHEARGRTASLGDVAVPMLRPAYQRNYKKLSELDPAALEPINAREELDRPLRISLEMEFATTGTHVSQVDVAAGQLALAEELLASITKKTIAGARLTAEFAELYPFVRAYVTVGCFGREINIDDEAVRSHLRSPRLQEGIAKYLASEVGTATVVARQ